MGDSKLAFQRSSIVRRAASATRAFPSGVRGPVDRPPCILQRPFRLHRSLGSRTGGAWQTVVDACPMETP
jgi:hypothetical protein